MDTSLPVMTKADLIENFELKRVRRPLLRLRRLSAS